MALEQRRPGNARNRIADTTHRLARAPSKRLGPMGRPSPDRRRRGGTAAMRPEESTLWRRCMDEKHRQKDWMARAEEDRPTEDDEAVMQEKLRLVPLIGL